MSRAYRLGLLFVVFGGFATIVSTGEPAVLGVTAMVLGLFVGVLGILHEGLPARDTETTSRKAATVRSWRSSKK